MDRQNERHKSIDRWISFGRWRLFSLFLFVTGVILIRVGHSLEPGVAYYILIFVGFCATVFGTAHCLILHWREEKTAFDRAISKVKRIKRRKTSQVDPFAEETGLYRISQEINIIPTITYRLFRIVPVDSKTLLPTGGLYRVTRVIKPPDFLRPPMADPVA